MRLSFSVALLLLFVEQFSQTAGFSILRTNSVGRTSLASSATPDAPAAERRKPASPAEILAKTRAAQGLPEDDEEPPKIFEDSLYDDMQNILLSLEKRVKDGPGSLSVMDVEEFRAGMDRVLVEMKEKESERVESLSAASAQPSPAASANTAEAAPVAPAAAAVVQEAVVEEPLIEVAAPVGEVAASEAEPDLEGLEFDQSDLLLAATRLDANAVGAIRKAGLQMDEATTDAAFWAVVNAVDAAEAKDEALPADVARMLHHIFDADMDHLLTRGKETINVTCMQPKEEGAEGSARRMNYIFDDSSHKDLPLSPGRRCEDGRCCDVCSRNIFREFATDPESSLEQFPEIASFTFNNLETVSTKSILQFTRLVERVRRTISHEYGVPLSYILPLQAYSRKYVAGTTQQGGGGGEGDFVTLHTDEATHAGYHYSCVLYLSTAGKDFEGGDFVFNDPEDPEVLKARAEKAANVDIHDEEADDYEEDPNLPIFEQIRRAGRKLTPFSPTRGAAVIFSSGWENMHEVETITSGTRYCVPCFFTTSPVPEQAYEQMVVGKPKTDEDIADDWLHLLLAHREESPLESTGRVKELLMKWHFMCTPLDRHYN